MTNTLALSNIPLGSFFKDFDGDRVVFISWCNKGLG